MTKGVKSIEKAGLNISALLFEKLISAFIAASNVRIS